MKSTSNSTPEIPESVAIEPSKDQWLKREESLSAEEFQQMNNRLKALCLLGQDVYTCQSYDNVLNRILGFVDKLLHPERCILAIQAPDGQLLSARSKGFETPQDTNDWPVSENLLRKVRSEHIAVLSTDAQEDNRLKDFKSINAMNIRSVLCVPLGTKDAPEGFVYLDSRLQASIFTKRDLLFLTAVCRLLDLTIQSIDRLEQERARSDRSTQRFQILQEELFRQHRIVGRSKPLILAYDQLKRIAQKTTLPILLRGETGTGKELFARAAHWMSPQRDGSFIASSLSASETLIESELFGHEKGAFTGADRRRIGLLERADGGVLFLDEIAKIPLGIQDKLLRALQEKEFRRIGGDEIIHSDFRLVAATNRDLEKLIHEGRFQEDLYARIAGVTIQLPPLRDRREDIPLLVNHFLKKEGLERKFSSQAMQLLQSLSWPRNVRQLQYAVQHIAAMSESDPISLQDTQAVLGTASASQAAMASWKVADLLAEAEKNHMLKALDHTGGNATKAAALIGVSKATFSEKRKRYRI